ncbi:pyridoxal phosphate-dependent aminotransferase [Pseudooceanicola aestuarii]|uniref:pyridoxal phosphate-dependent aminotransferase n=1 Tax=Pseudooceanicola aestuarii TaxID=2697319 RepID=UPI0013D4D4BA|nr:pyridoxal phosphate-dependent aminotransferase [Pseudooceanicola aestuarii]
MSDTRLTPLAQSLPATVPFIGPEELERRRGAPFAARLGANENVFGPSPKAIAAMQAATPDLWKYGDSASHDLCVALAEHLDTRLETVTVGEGVDGLLGLLVRLLVAPGDRVVTSHGAYPTFNYHVQGFGGELVTVPYKGDHEDPRALFAKARETGAKLVYLANPDNPMGSYLNGQDIADALADLPDHALLVLDEAYIECAPEAALAPIAYDDPRVIRMRTFSKAYALAGARVGYAIGDPTLIAAFDTVRNHFGMHRTAQDGALAALADQDHLRDTVARIAASREEIARIARDNGLVPLPSATNFVTADTGGDGDTARSLVAALGARGVFVRMPFVAPQDRCIRISCGTPEDLLRLEEALPAALAEINSAG